MFLSSKDNGGTMHLGTHRKSQIERWLAMLFFSDKRDASSLPQQIY